MQNTVEEQDSHSAPQQIACRLLNSRRGSADSEMCAGINGPCSFMQDKFLPAATISPSPATCVVATAFPAYMPPNGPALPGPIYKPLAWCACGDNALYPLFTQYTNGFTDSAFVNFCSYTTTPTFTIAPTVLASTSCQ